MPKKFLLLFFCFLIASGASAEICKPGENHFTPAPLPKNSSSWQSKHQKQKLRALQINSGVMLIGDSMIERWPNDMLTTAFDGTEILNLGIGGDRTQHVLWRLNNLDLSQQNPSHTILLIGTNNLSRFDSACSISAGIEKIVLKIRHLMPETKIVIIGILPRGEGFSYRKNEISDINLKLKALQDQQITFLDPSSVFSKPEEEKENFIPDRIHLTRHGYGKLTQLLQQRLAKSRTSLR